jgi:hypothetical protein
MFSAFFLKVKKKKKKKKDIPKLRPLLSSNNPSTLPRLYYQGCSTSGKKSRHQLREPNWITPISP